MRGLNERAAGKGVARGAVLLGLLLATAGCAGSMALDLDDRNRAVGAVNSAWFAENETIRAGNGSRTLNATPDQVYRASRAAMERLELQIDEAQSAMPNVTARHTYAGGTWSWNPAVRQVEEPRMRAIFVATLGPRGEKLIGTPGDETLTGKATIAAISKTVTRVTVDFRAVQLGACPAKQACIVEMPPAALRSAYFEYWSGFAAELATVIEDDRAAAETARRARGPARRAAPRARTKAKPRSQWVLPPSGWTPPN